MIIVDFIIDIFKNLNETYVNCILNQTYNETFYKDFFYIE